MEAAKPETESAEASWRDLLESDQLSRFGLLCLGIWLHAADTLLVATLMPTAVQDIGGVAYISWTIALYQVGSIVAGASTALLTVHIGLRNAKLLAALVYAIGCVASALAPDMAVMLIGRTLQGLGGGAMVALAFIATGQLFPERLWPRLMALISSIWGASALCGPLIGGLFASWGIWRGGFWAFAIQAGILALLAFFLLKRGETTEEKADALPGLRLTLLSSSILAVALAGAAPAPLRSTLLCAAAVGLFLLFLHYDGRAKESLLPHRPFALGQAVGAGNLMVLAFSTATVSFTTYGPLIMLLRFGTDPLTAGYVIALESVSWTLGALAFASAAQRWEPLLIRGGAFLLTLSIVGFTFTAPTAPLVAWLPWAVLQGAGFGMAWGFIVRRAVAGAAPHEREKASAALPTLQLTGYAVGAAASGIAANAAGFAQGASTEAAPAVAFWIFAVFVPVALLGCLAAWRLGSAKQT